MILKLRQSRTRRGSFFRSIWTAEGIADIVLIGTPEEIAANKGDYDLTGITVIDPTTDPNRQKYIDKFVELRAKKGVTPEQAEEQMMKDYMYYACLMCKCGDADGAVSGACHSTGNTIRPALQLLKTKPGIHSVSGFFVMDVPDCEFGENGRFVFADCAVNVDFDSEKLAEIAILSADSFKAFIGAEPKVAMLSYSTKGSAKHDDVTKVAEAVKLVKEQRPDIKVDGELQFDAARICQHDHFPEPGSRQHRLQAGTETCQGRRIRPGAAGTVHAGQRPVQRMLCR